MKTIIAIDPGASGGLAIADTAGTIVLKAMPDTQGDILEIIAEAVCSVPAKTDCCVYVEKVGGFVAGNPSPGSAMFNFGDNYGFIKGVCQALGLPLRLVTPQQWQKGMELPTGGGKSKDDRKRELKAEAQRRYPNVAGITLKTADALLILGYAVGKENPQVEREAA